MSISSRRSTQHRASYAHARAGLRQVWRAAATALGLQVTRRAHTCRLAGETELVRGGGRDEGLAPWLLLRSCPSGPLRLLDDDRWRLERPATSGL
jgi:hypothetical protein